MIDEEIRISTAYIKLDQLLKFSGVCTIGSEAKDIILSGKVLVNGVRCDMRGKKIRSGDIISVNGQKIKVSD